MPTTDVRSPNTTTRDCRSPTKHSLLQELNDGELLEALVAGEQQAYGILVGRYEQIALRVARRRTSDHHLALDAVQESFAAILSAIKSGAGPKGTFTNYLYSTVRREVDRQHRVRKHEVSIAEYPESLPGTLVADVADQLPDEQLWQAFNSLPERWQYAIWYIDINGVPPRQAAPLFGLSSNAFVSLHRRAKKGLRQAFLQQQAAH